MILSATDATTADIATSTDRNYVTDVQVGVLSNTSGINTGDETTASIKSKLGVTTISGVNTGDQTIALTGDVTGSGTGTFTTTLSNTGVVANTYGSNTSIPTFSVDEKGRISNATSIPLSSITSIDAGNLTGTTLASNVLTSSLTSVGNISNGVWNGSTIGYARGGTGLTSPGASGNVLAALQGKTAGAQIIQNSGDPAGGMSVRLRGISSVLSSSEPLYIVDGVIINNATNRVTNTSGNYDGGNFVGSIGQNRMVDINPADIERIEVLNGAAAAATYGSRANAGVIQIFTKRGKSGAAKVSFSSTYISSALRKKLDVNQSPTKFGGPTDGVGAQTQDVLTPTLTNTTSVTRYDYQDYIFRDVS